MIDFDNDSTPLTRTSAGDVPTVAKAHAIGLLSERVDEIEDTIKAVKGHGWKAALAIITTLLGSTAAIVATLQAKAEREGMMTERSLTMQRDIAELKAELKARGDQCRAPRRDYDYDLLAPRPIAPPPKKDP